MDEDNATVEENPMLSTAKTNNLTKLKITVQSIT
jgi:hypothetical protein